MNETILQIFLGVNLLLLGGLIAILVQYILVHHRDKKTPTSATNQLALIPKTVRTQLAEASAHQLKTILDQTSANFKGDLHSTSKQLNSLLKQFGTSILDDEMKLFREHLQEIRRQTESAVGAVSLEVGDQQARLEAELAERQSQFEAKLRALQVALEQSLSLRQTELSESLSERKSQLIDKLDTEFVAERNRLHAQIDTKLGDAVATFLTETLQHNIDLGAQTEYLGALLEQHKNELKAATQGDSALLDPQANQPQETA